MPKERLNLLIDQSAIAKARRYSHRHATSISRLVSDFLAGLPVEEGVDASELSPAVQRLRGLARGGPDREDHRRHLLEKHGR